MKTSFVIREDMVTLFESLDDVSAGQLIKGLCAHQKGENAVIENGILNAALSMFCAWLDEDNRRYEEKCKKNSENIRKRWNKSDIPTDTTVYERIPTDTTAIPDDTKNTDKDNDKDIKKDSPSESRKKSRAAFCPPTVDEVRAFEREKGYGDEADAFVDFYASKGWMVGKSKMVSWQSARSGWERRRKERASPKKEYHNRYNDFPQRQYTTEEWKQIEDDWIRSSFGA